MKQIYLTILLALSVHSINAQTLTFTDPVFKQMLLDAGFEANVARDNEMEWVAIDTNEDGEIQQTEANAISYLTLVDSYDITSIEGIHGFTNLKGISLEEQSITDVDVSGMINLEYVEATEATLSTLDVSGCTNLISLQPGYFTVSLDMSDCSSLLQLYVRPYLEEINFEGCDNLIELSSSDANTHITSLDVSGLPSIEQINWHDGALSSFNAAGCTTLQTVYFGHCNLSDINLSGCSSLTSFFFEYEPLESLNMSNCSALTTISLDDFPDLSTFNIQGCTTLESLTLYGSNINDLSLSDLPNLVNLTLENNSMSSANFSGLTSLQNLYLIDNELIEIDLTGLESLDYIKIFDEDVSSLNIAGCTNLTNIECIDTALTSVDFTENQALSFVKFDNCGVNIVDLTTAPELLVLVCIDTPLLQTVKLKNGGSEMQGIAFENTPQLEYVCADDQDFDLLNDYFETNSMDVTVDSTCSFQPSEDYNSISGIIRFDSNTNGCDGTDTVIGDMKFSIQRDGEEAFIFSNNEGNYIAYAEEGIETVILTPEIDSDLFTITPASVTQEFTETGNAITADFCITPNGIHHDLDVVLLPIFDARPGFEATYQLIINNKGNQIQSGSVTLAYNDGVIDFISASLTPSTTNTGSLTWDITELSPFNNIIVNLTFEVNTPQEDPSVNVGDILPFTAAITTTETDDTPNDNIYQFNQVVIGAIDPNDKQIAEGTSITPEQVGDYLHYLIRFQNTGTAEAINVRVEDVLANNLDWDTFTPVSASHEYRVTLTDGNKAEFFFENIMLPAEEDNEPESHGFVAFKIKPLPGAQLGDIFENTAEIYFDFESAIVTNTVTTTVEEIMSTGDFNFNNYFMVYPNPTKDIAIIKAKGSLGINTVNIYNMLGQLVSSAENTGASMDTNLDISHLQDGQYLLEIITNKGKSICKLIKQ